MVHAIKRTGSIAVLVIVLSVMRGGAYAHGSKAIGLEKDMKTACDLLKKSFPGGCVSVVLRTGWHNEMSKLYRESKRTLAEVRLSKGSDGVRKIEVTVKYEINDNVDDPASVKNARWIPVSAEGAARSKKLKKLICAALEDRGDG